MDNLFLEKLSINKGELVLVCGRTGCGKTTLQKQMKKDAGQSAGYVMQNPDNQIVCDEVCQELAFGLVNSGMDENSTRARIAETASYFGITRWLHRSTDTLSGGEKQILNLAAVMAQKPELLLLDEPTAMLDPVMAERLLDLVINLNRDYGITVVISEHRPEILFGRADKVLLIEKGERLCMEPDRMAEYMGQNNELSWMLPSAARIFSGYTPVPVSINQGIRAAARLADINYREPEIHENKNDVALELKKITFTYKRQLQPVIRDMELKVCKGEVYALLGENGSGKTTAAYLAAGTLKPYEGRVVRKGSTAMLMQDVTCHFLEDELTGRFEGRNPYDLSGGEQQLAALDIVMKNNPDILILDEPTKGLDAIEKNKFVNEIRRLSESGIAVLMVTHDVELAAMSADVMAIMYDGGIVNEGTPHEFMKNNMFYTTAAARIFKNIADVCTVEEAQRLTGECK